MKKNLTLLIIDDDPTDIGFFTEAVSQIDHNIVCKVARDGQAGLEILRADLAVLPDLIFLDLRMPRISGKKFLSLIKEDNLLKHIPVVIYTTSHEVEESIRLTDMGAIRFVSKPSDPEEIYYLVSVVLEELISKTQD